MEHLIIRHAPQETKQAIEWARVTPDGDLLDLDVFAHQGTFLLSAVGSDSGRLAYLPVQQPLMLENLIFRPGLSDRDRARAITRMTEYAIGEAYRRDVGELYFLCRHAETCAFAERHGFRELAKDLRFYRMNLREMFGD
jgi:hypothetical protein